MADYFVLDWDAKETIVGHVADSSNRSLGSRFLRGRRLAPDLNPVALEVRVEVAPEGGFPDYFTLQQVPIVSERFLEAARPFVDSFENFAAPIIQGDRTVSGHFVLNVVGRVACLDYEASDVTFVDDERDAILRIKKLEIDGIRAGDFDMARLHEFEPLILVSSQVSRALRGLDGVSVLPAKGWSDSVWF